MSKSESGAVLMWAVCSMAVLVMVMTLVAGGFIRATKASQDTRLRLAALGVAEREMERLKATPFASLPANGQTQCAWAGLDALPAGRGVQTLAPAPVSGMRQIAVRVEWRELQGPAHAVELTALRSPRGE